MTSFLGPYSANLLKDESLFRQDRLIEFSNLIKPYNLHLPLVRSYDRHFYSVIVAWMWKCYQPRASTRVNRQAMSLIEASPHPLLRGFKHIFFSLKNLFRKPIWRTLQLAVGIQPNGFNFRLLVINKFYGHPVFRSVHQLNNVAWVHNSSYLKMHERGKVNYLSYQDKE